VMASTSDLIGIPFPDHSSELLSSLNEQRQNGLLCDVVLIVKDQEYRTHRSVLAACSKYFKTLFTADTLADQHSVYEIDFVTPEALSAILEFAYTSTLTISPSDVKDILSAAQLLEIQCISKVCIDIMDSSGDIISEGNEPVEPSTQIELQEHLEQEVVKESPQEDIKDLPLDPIKDPQENVQADFQNGEHWIKDYNLEGTSNKPHMDKHHAEPPRDILNELLIGEASGRLGPVHDFSLDSLLNGGINSRANILDRRNNVSPLRSRFFPPYWNSNYNPFPLLREHQDIDQVPLNLVVKKEQIKEEIKEDLPSATSACDFLKDMLLQSNRNNFGAVKEELDFRSYLSMLDPSFLAAVYPTWTLEDEKKMRPKASQQCPICNKVIQGAGKLPRHMRTHTGEKPYTCNICGVRFTRQDKLKIHMRKHTGERPYTCVHCSARFVHNYDLKNHMRIHTGVRPYQCQHCFKSFTRSDHLHRHIKRLSCRLPRPRRGRRPAAWRSASLLYPLGATQPDQGAANFLAQEVGRLPNAGKLQQSHAESFFNSRIFGGDPEREIPTARMLNGNHFEDESNRGIFTLALSHTSAFSHLPRQYFATGNPWAPRFNPTIPMQEIRQ
uniref:Zinc finger and BTB domain-containing protein 7C n=1 Tax=Callorhinchus milii TaxID=7868 RepID=A0A4W3JKW6_CALMI